jgi:hypothetical protein
MIAINPLAISVEAPEGANADNGKPRTGEQTPRQDLKRSRMMAWGALPWANGGSDTNPCGFPGYGSLYTGTYATYRFMLDHPRLRHARADVMDPILANDLGWMKREDAPDAWLKFIRDTVEPLVLPTKTEGLRALDYGHYKFEKVWASKRSRLVIEELKPLAVDTNQILIEKGGAFAGIRFGNQNEWLDRRYSFCWTFDGEAGELYGRPLLENSRQHAWRDWLDCATQIQWLSYKICGKLAVIMTPPGTFTDEATGTQVNWEENAAAAGAVLASPASNGVIWFPTLMLPDVRTPENAAFAKISPVSIDVKDFGNHAPAIAGLLDRMRADEELMFASYLRSPRTGMETRRGNSQADAEVHTNTADIVSELVELWFWDSFRKQVIDDLLVVNFGEGARGSVWPKPSKLRDESVAVDLKLLDGLAQTPDMLAQFQERVDWMALAKRRGIPIVGDGPITLRQIILDETNNGDTAPANQG